MFFSLGNSSGLGNFFGLGRAERMEARRLASATTVAMGDAAGPRRFLGAGAPVDLFAVCLVRGMVLLEWEWVGGDLCQRERDAKLGVTVTRF